jgi:hypothetical protein
MENFLKFLQDSRNSNLIAVIAILVGWLIWRLGVWTQRRSVIDSLTKELDLHKGWVGNQYYNGIIPAGSNWHLLSYVVFKLSTEAVDNAIAQGPSLFLNKQLITQLIGYRQRVNQFNQLVDAAMDFQANPDIWKPRPNRALVKRMLDLTCQIHWYGISNSNEPLTYTYFVLVNQELEIEKSTKVLPFLWFLLGINLLGVKRFLIKYL